ncbi:MAG: undecaprenyl-diphosphate phosphatase [Staphylococcus epidermidis]|nr:undecaprenyl-diphosphate phosphatase [Staphylococcus epidermidis]
MFLLELIKGIILGIVEGLTEFAPVSSTGHMILVDDMWLKSTNFLGSQSAFTFKVVIQLGSVFAAAWVFRERFLEILHIGQHKPEPSTSGDRRSKPRRLNLIHVLVGMVPAGILGFLFDDLIEKYLPGFSRSGSTISTGVLMKLNHKAASDFTFIMSVPIMLAASGLSLLKHYEYIHLAHIPFYILGFLAAFIVGLIAIKTFLHLINKVKLVPFAIYRIVLVIFIAILYFGFGIGKGI